MSTFWIVGIVLNVSLTGLILYWLIKQGRPRDKSRSSGTEATKPSSTDTAPRKSTADETDME